MSITLKTILVFSVSINSAKPSRLTWLVRRRLSLSTRASMEVIFDLRNNGGGLLNETDSVAGVWLDEGQVVVLQKRGDEVVDKRESTGPATLKGVPTVVFDQ